MPDAFWKDRVFVGATALTVVLSVPFVLPLFSGAARATYADRYSTFPLLVVVLVTLRWKLGERSVAELRFWNLLTAGVVSWLLQQILVLVTWNGPLTLWLGLLSDVGYLGYYVFLVLAMDAGAELPAVETEGRLLPFLRQAGTVLFVFGLLVYMILVPARFDAKIYWTTVPSLGLYTLLDLYLIFRVLRSRARATSFRWRAIYGWLLVTSGIWCVLDFVEMLFWMEWLPWIPSGTPWDIPWMLPLLTMVMVGRTRTRADQIEEVETGVVTGAEGRALSLGIPLIVLTVSLPAIHGALYGLGVFGAPTRSAHEVLVLAMVLSMGLLVLVYQTALEKQNRRLEVQRREALARVEHLASHDPLTGLPNRRLLMDRGGQALARAERSGRGIALLYLDLDGFKVINDARGHGAGDDLLRRIGARLAGRVRAEDTLARIGGDEFVVLVNDLANRAVAEKVAEEIAAGLDAPFEMEGGQVQIRASMGLAYSPEDGRVLVDLLEAADRAMYRVKDVR